VFIRGKLVFKRISS